ncbi:MAG: hypothetical protein MUE41_15925, partial [Gemmatimonadaceae bacterium]|nr:hypothetical protein [Gemmatimonadaceae bacterium]
MSPLATPERRHAVFFTGQSSYGVLGFLTTELARALKACGWTAEILDLSRLHIPRELGRIADEGGASLFCGLSGYGSDLVLDGRLLYDQVDATYVGLMLDSPCYFPHRHLTSTPRHLFLHGDDGHHDVSVEVSPAGSWRGLFRLGATPESTPLAPVSRRRPTVLFASKGGDPDAYALQLRRSLDADAFAFVRDVADALEAHHAPRRAWEVARARLA